MEVVLGVGGESLQVVRRWPFGLLLAGALLGGIVEFGCWVVLGWSCINGGHVACYGGDGHVSAAPGNLVDGAILVVFTLATVAVGIVSLLGLAGVRRVRRRKLLIGGLVVLALSAPAVVLATVFDLAPPPDSWCAKHSCPSD